MRLHRVIHHICASHSLRRTSAKPRTILFQQADGANTSAESAFGELRYRSHQIYFVHDFAKWNGDRVLSVHQFSRVFGCDAGRVKAALANGLNEPKLRGRHFAFSDDSETEILEYLQSQPEKYEPITRTDLRHSCEAKYSRSISRGWIDSFILSHRDDLLETKSSLQENARL
jgi:hypothetical protein